LPLAWTHRRWMLDLDSLATGLYVRTDDLLKASPELAPHRPGVGIAPRLSDAELVTLAVMQASARLHLRAPASPCPRSPTAPVPVPAPAVSATTSGCKAAGLILQVNRRLAVDTTLWTDTVRMVEAKAERPVVPSSAPPTRHRLRRRVRGPLPAAHRPRRARRDRRSLDGLARRARAPSLAWIGAGITALAAYGFVAPSRTTPTSDASSPPTAASSSPAPSPGACCLAFPGVSGAIVGAHRPDHVDGWIAAAHLELDDRDLAEIAEAITRTGAGDGPRRPGHDAGWSATSTAE